MPIVMFVAGLIILLVGADLLIRSAVSLARALGIPTLIIGLTVVAFGTSAPELAAGIAAVLSGNGEINIGNVVGSNIANVGLILGITALVYPVVCHVRAIRLEVPIMIAVCILGYLLMVRGQLVSRADGAVLIAVLIAYIVLIVVLAQRDRARAARHAKKQQAIDLAHDIAQQTAPLNDHPSDPDNDPNDDADNENKEKADSFDPRTDSIDLEIDDALAISDKVYSPLFSVFFVLLGLAGLMFGSTMLVDGAVEIATVIGVPKSVVALTMVAFGTSVPELAAAIMAARKQEPDLIIGNIIGSNIFNIVCVLGITSMVAPIDTPDTVFGRDGPMMILLAALMLPLMLRKGRIGRGEGAILLLLYVGYFASTFVI